MKYIFTLGLFLSLQCAQAQIGLIMNGTRAATSAALMAARHKKKAKTTTTLNKTDAPAATPATDYRVVPFTYNQQSVPCKRTTEAAFKGKGGPEILALEALLEQSRTALLADSAQSFLSVTQLETIVAADRKAVATRPNWNYAPYRQELEFYKKEEARRQSAVQPVPAK